jgi:hypothetical protein
LAHDNTACRQIGRRLNNHQTKTMFSFLNQFACSAGPCRKASQFCVRGTGALLLLAVTFASGCKSLDKPASVSFASVTLSRAYTTEQIQQAAVKVFRQNGYQSFPQPDGSLMFQREATRGEQISYAGIYGAQQGEKVVIQVRMTIEVRDSGTWWVGCKAFAVSNPDDPIYSSTSPLMHFQSKPYQKLMDEVKNAVQFPPAVQ